MSRLEGIIPALETSHAFAYLEKLCPTVPDGTRIVLNCSGRGDKDVTVRRSGAGQVETRHAGLGCVLDSEDGHLMCLASWRRCVSAPACPPVPLPARPQNAANYLPHLAGGPKP